MLADFSFQVQDGHIVKRLNENSGGKIELGYFVSQYIKYGVNSPILIIPAQDNSCNGLTIPVFPVCRLTLYVPLASSPFISIHGHKKTAFNATKKINSEIDVYSNNGSLRRDADLFKCSCSALATDLSLSLNGLDRTSMHEFQFGMQCHIGVEDLYWVVSFF